MTIQDAMVKIQTTLIAPKNQFNSFGKYKYRSCEDILEGLKPLLKETGCFLVIRDEIVEIGGRFYVKATAALSSGTASITSTAYAREAETKKGMDESQITGATSSYARKYALNGLFCIDDTKDADHGKPNGEYITEKQVSFIRDGLADIGADEKKLLAHLKVESLERLPVSDYQKAIAAIESKKEKK